MCSPTTDQANFNGLLCLLIFLLNGIFQKTLQTKTIIFMKSCPWTGQIKEWKFQDFANFQYLSSLPYDHFQNTCGRFVFTDLLVPTLQMCENPMYLSCTKQQLYITLYTVWYTIMYTLLYNRMCLGAQISRWFNRYGGAPTFLSLVKCT